MFLQCSLAPYQEDQGVRGLVERSHLGTRSASPLISGCSQLHLKLSENQCYGSQCIICIAPFASDFYILEWCS